MGAGTHQSDRGCENCRQYAHLGRRRFLGLLGLGVAAVLGGCAEARGNRLAAVAGEYGMHADNSGALAPPDEGMPVTAGANLSGPSGAVLADPGQTTSYGEGGAASAQPAGVPVANPGAPVIFTHGPKGTKQVAITIDDGYCAECVASYVEFAKTSGIHLTFSPNGVYGDLWDPHASSLVPLIEAGQVQIGNHTYSHQDVTRLSDRRLKTELERNEAWIERTFGITSRPWYRPPFGRHNHHSDGIAADLGFTNILMWNGSFGDAALLTPQVLMTQAKLYLKPGTIVLGHANHPTVTHLFPQIEEIIAQRGLEPVTLDEMFGTSRSSG